MTKFIFLGPPGSGKGTQGSLLATEMNLSHISTGELLRSAVSQQTDLGMAAQGYMQRGELVPDELVLGLVQERLENLNGFSGWILDGFPRNIDQAKTLDLLLSKVQQNPDYAVNLDVPDDILLQRLLSRGRDDDNEEVVRKRLEVYREKTAPLINFYEQRQQLVSVQGNAEVQEVTRRLKAAITSAPQSQVSS